MPSVNVKSDILGVNLQLDSDFELDERGVFDVLREHDPRLPTRLLKKFNRYREDEKVQNLTLKALDNDFFESGGSFMDALGETASLAGEGLENIPLSLQLGWQFKTFAPKYAHVDPSKYNDSRWNTPVTEAAKYLTGLTESKQTATSVLLPGMTGSIDRIDEDMGKALQFAGLPDDPPMRKKVTDRLLGLDESRTLATRGQAAVEAWAMSATIGEKGKQYVKEFKDLVTGNATEKGDKLTYLDYLYQQNKIGEVMEEGAETAALLGGVTGVVLSAFTLDPEKGSVFGQSPVDEQTLKELRSGAVEPDRAQSLVMSIPMSPDFALTLGAAGGIHVVRNSVNRGAIIGLSAKASEESAFAATVKQLSELPKRSATKNALLANAKKRLADVAGSQEKLNKLVAKNRGIAEAVGISAVEKGGRFSPTTASLMEALNRAPGPKAPFLNRKVGQALKAAGVSTEYLGRTVEFLHRLPEEALTTVWMRTGMEAEAARGMARAATRGTLYVGAAGAATGGFEFDLDLTQLAVGLLLAPGGHQILTRLGKDISIYGKELTRAQASSPLFQRLAQMEPVEASLTNVLLDRTSALTLGETVSNLRGAVFAPTREFGISPALKIPSAVLTRTGAGNTLTGLANTARTAAYASTFPLALGYAVGGEEGAGSALGASIPILVVGMGLGHMARVKGKAELHQKMLGDEAIYKEDYLNTDSERTTFEGFSRTGRQALATSALQNPDVVYNFKTGRGNPSHEIVNGESVITIYEKATTAEILSAVLGHEIAHHIDSYGFHPQIIDELLGSVEKDAPGAFTEFKDGKPIIVTDKDGNQVYKTNDEFAKHRQQYLDRLERAGYDKDSPQYQSYANDDYRIAREVFASHGAAWYFGAEFVKNNYQGAGAKLMGKILEPLFNSNGLRKFFHRIGLATEESSGLVADPTGLMPGLKEIPALTKMIKKYNDEVRGLDRSGRKSWAAKRGSLVDEAFGDELATALFTAKDLENPAIAESLKMGGHVSIREDGSIEVDASGKPVFLPAREVNKRNKRLSNDILEIIKKKEDAGESFGAGHVTLETTVDGKLRASGRFLDPSIIDELVKLNRYNPHQLDALKMINKTLKNGEGDAWNLFYYSALKWNKAGRKVYGQIKGGDRISLPFGIELTKDGNVIIQTISYDAFKKNLNWFANSKGWGQKMQEAFGTRNADGNLMPTPETVLVKRAMDLLPKYLDNHTRGVENGVEGSGVSVAQRDFINAAIGRVNAEQVAKNPILEGLGDRRSQRQQSIRSRRLDRIGNARRGDPIGSVNLNKVGQNLAALMPQLELDFSPPKQATEAKPNFWKVYKIDPKGPKVYDQVADVLIQAGSPWMDGSIVESQAGKLKLDQNKLLQAMNRAHRRSDRGGGKQFMPSGDRAKVGGQIGKNQEFYKGGQWLPSTTMPKRERQSIRKAATGKEQFEPYKWEVPEPGKKPILGEYDVFSNLGDEQFIKYQGYSPTEINFYREMKARWDAGERYYDIYEFPFKANKKDVSRLYEAGKEILPEMLVDRDGNPKHFAEVFQKFPQKQGGEGKQFMPAAYHGTPHTFKAEEGAPLGKFKTAQTTPASVQSWDGANPIFATKLTKGMAKDNKEVAALLRQVYEDTFGEPLRAQDFSDTEVSWLADMLATEGEAALGRTGNAVNWYTSAVERALSIAEEIFPDIGKKFEAKDRFLGALSITSQSMRVLDNAKATEMQYEHKQRTGKFNYDVKHGAVAEAITQNLKMYDQIEAKMGIEAFHKFLDRDFTVKKLSEWGKDFFKDKDFSIAGYQTDKVKGSAVFGPKIGQGFFQNLRGNYDPVTVDLWLRRTYGRLTGLALDTALAPKDIGRIIYSVRKNVGKRKFAGLELPKFLQGVRITGKLQKDGVANFKISDKSFEALFGDNTIGRDNTEAFFDFADKLNRGWERKFSKAGTDVKKANDAIRKAKKKGRGFANLEKKLAKLEVEKEAIGKEKPQWAKAGSTVTGKLKPIDVPSNAERAVITKAFNKALAQLKAKGIDLTPADLQATLWYPEKDIWGYLKGDKSNALNMSYDTAFEIIRDQRK